LASALLDGEAAEPAIAVMHDDSGGSLRAGEAVCRALGVHRVRVHGGGLVVVGNADSPHASATGNNMHAPLGSWMGFGCWHGSKLPRPRPHVVVREP
jgi:hypothetical protein